MSKIVYIPLDERPCNLAYPLRLFTQLDDVTVVAPPVALLGHKKVPANVSALRDFLKAESADADAVVYSTEMLAYGGLLPSRIYPEANKPDIAEYEAFLKGLKATNPALKLYGSNLIMRTPRYSSGDEEPAYYEDYGAEIFRYGWLIDKENREGLDDAERAEERQLSRTVPAEDIADYEQRRENNLKVNLANIDLVQAGVIDYLAIPQDDSAPYGYTAHDQAAVYPLIKKTRLQARIGTYPGADEAGYTLLARAVQGLTGGSFSIYPLYASEIGKTQIPLYEDRPLCESVKSHILSAGAQVALSPESADLILAVNTPGKQMIEARDQRTHADVTYDTYRNLRAFVSQIGVLLDAGKAVAVADSAYANGADLELIEMLDTQGLLPKLAAYRGWNTNCNTLGSTISAAMIQRQATPAVRWHEILTALLDDAFYQSVVRGEVTDNWLPRFGLNYFDLKDQAEAVGAEVAKQIETLAATTLQHSLAGAKLQPQISFPWNRMFEINCAYTTLEV